MPDRVRRAERFVFAGARSCRRSGSPRSRWQIGGAVVLMLVALRMVFPSPEGVYGQSPGGRALHRAAGGTGPGRSVGTRHRDVARFTRPSRSLEWVAAIAVVMAISAMVLVSATGCNVCWASG